MRSAAGVSLLLTFGACTVATPGYEAGDTEGTDGGSVGTGDGDGDAASATGDGTTGDGDGTTGDGDGTTGDGDGTTGDGDGTTGDGDGMCGDGDVSPGPNITGCDVQPVSLRACYLFDQINGGMITDGSAYGNDLAVVGAASLGPGVNGMALDSTVLTGAEAPGDPSLDQTAGMTIEFWMNPDTWQGPVHYVAERAGQWAILQQQNVFICDLGPASAEAEGMSLPPTGVWTHVACVLDQSEARLYYDGVLAASAPRLPMCEGPATGGMAIGTRPTTPEVGFRGRIDEFRLWSVVRTDDQICASAGC